MKRPLPPDTVAESVLATVRLNRMQIAGLAAYLAGRRRIAIRAGWGAGKSWLLGWIALIAGEQGTSVMWVTDTGPRLQTVVQPVCEALLRPCGWAFNGDKNCWTKGKATIWLRSYFRPSTKSSESNSAEGANVGLVLLDECQTWTNDEPLRKLFGRARVGPVAPAVVMAGLPIYGAWWEDAARKMGRTGAVIMGTSYDNRDVLRPEWFADALATLGEREYEAMLCNRPRAPEGQIYDGWKPEPYEHGGHIISGWTWRREFHTVLALDFGKTAPAALLLAEDPALNAWVICGEVNPRRRSSKVPEFAADILAMAWPRYLEDEAPLGVKLRFDDVVGDRAGGQRQSDDRTGELFDSHLDIIAEMPALTAADGGGIGIRPRVLDRDAADFRDRDSVKSGIIRVTRAIERRAILCTAEVWEEGMRATGRERSFARSILGYRYDAKGEPRKDEGHDHILDALRYWARDDASGLWFSHPTDHHRSVVMSNPWASAAFSP